MAKYRAEVILTNVGYLEFEADNDELAYDHMGKVLGDHQSDPNSFWDFYIERTAPSYLGYTKLETWKEI